METTDNSKSESESEGWLLVGREEDEVHYVKEEADLAIVDLYYLLLDVFLLNVLRNCALAGPIRKRGRRPAHGHSTVSTQ